MTGHKLASALLFAALAVGSVDCGSRRPPPTVPASPLVGKLHNEAGRGIQDCGEALEASDDERCHVRSVGECIAAALKACRPAHGIYIYEIAAGADPVRLDWLVMVRQPGTCEFVVVDERVTDPLAPKTTSELVCQAPGWKRHERIPGCEVLDPQNCRSRSGAAPSQTPSSGTPPAAGGQPLPPPPPAAPPPLHTPPPPAPPPVYP